MELKLFIMTVQSNLKRSQLIFQPAITSLSVAVIAIAFNIFVGIYCDSKNLIIENHYIKYGVLYILFPVVWLFITSVILRVLILQNAYKKWIKPVIDQWFESMFSDSSNLLSNPSQIPSFLHLKIRERGKAYRVNWIEEQLFAYVNQFKWSEQVAEIKSNERKIGKLEAEFDYEMQRKLSLRKFPLISLIVINLLSALYIMIF